MKNEQAIDTRRSATTTKVFVGSLPAEATTDDLRKLFAPYGAIAECDIANRCGFLHLEDRELAMKAIEELNNTTFMGTKISVEKGRVKPPRGRGGGGPMKGGRDRGGPYARNGMGRQRNGGFGGRDFYGGGDRYNRFDDRGMGGPRGYDGYDRRPPFDDHRGGPGGYPDRRPYNGFDRRGNFPDERGAPPYDQRGPMGGGYNDRSGAPGGGYGDRRPLMDMGGWEGAPKPGGYDRSAPTTGNEMYSRRGDPGPKPLMSGSNYAGNMPPAAGYGSGSGGYGGPAGGTGPGYMDSRAPATYDATPRPAGYNEPHAATGSTYDSRGGYGMDTRAPPASSYTASTAAGGYGTAGGNYAPTGGSYAATGGNYGPPAGGSYGATAGGYGDNYAGAGGAAGNRGGGYDTAYPPLPQRSGGFSSGAAGPGPRRDAPPGRRY